VFGKNASGADVAEIECRRGARGAKLLPAIFARRGDAVPNEVYLLRKSI
jgi:hypothetical protein